MRKLKLGVLGTSTIAQKSIIPTIHKLKNHFSLIGVGGRDIDKTISYCEPHGLKAFSSYKSLLESDIDVIYIPLPNSLHMEWATIAMNRGIHVVCEKSLGCNLKEVQEMTNIARSRNLLLLEHFQFRFHRQLEKIKEILPDIGEIRTINSSFTIPPFKNKENIRYQKNLGGGALLDNGAYTTKIASIFLGDNLKVEHCSLNNNEFNVDIWGNLTLYDPKSGVTFNGSFGFDHSYSCELQLVGSKGKIYTDRIFTSPIDHQPTINIEIQNGYTIIKDKILVEPDDHFLNLWMYVYDLIKRKEFEFEYSQNIVQSKILNECLIKAYEK